MKKLSLRIAFLVLGSVMAVDRVGYAQVAPPSINKTFGAATIPLNGTTSLTFGIFNNNPGTFLTGVAFTDTLPAGLVVATPNGLTGSCGIGTITATAGSGTISLSGALLGPVIGCGFGVNVTGTTAGVKNNSVTVTSTEGGTGNTSNASITVVAPPVIFKAFGAASIPLNGTTTLTFSIQNPAQLIPLTGVAFTDNLPAGLVVATPNGLSNTCGTATAVAGSGTISLSGGTLPAPLGLCFVIVNVTGTTAGVKNNTSSNVSSTNGGTGNTASASITVLAPTDTPTNTPTSTPTNTPTSTPTSTATNTPTSTATNTPTSTPTGTPTPVPVVPTLNQSGMLIFGLLIAAAGLLLLIRKR